MYILLSKRIAIEGVIGGGGFLAIFCISVIHAKLCHVRQYLLCINERIELHILSNQWIFEQGYRRSEKSFYKENCTCVPTYNKVFRETYYLVSGFFFQGQHIYFQIVPPPHSESYDRPLKFKLINIVINL